MLKIYAKKEALVEARVRNNMLQRDLAKKIGVATKTISLIETGQTNPRPGNAYKICDALGKGFDDLFVVGQGE